MDWNKWLMLSWKKLGLLVILWVGFVILHNAIYGFFGYEEAMFFILAVFVLPLYFIVMVVYSLIRKFS